MGLLQKAAETIMWGIIERRSSLENPSTPLSFPAEWLLDIFNGGRTDSGIRVSEMTALQTDAVLACVSIISKGVASLPLHVYEQQMKDGRASKMVSISHPLYDILKDEPNEEMTSHTFRGVMMVHCLLWGNAYAEIQRDNGNRIVALWPRNPARTRPVRLTADARIQGTLYPRGTLIYHTSETMGDEISFQDDNQNRMAPERIILAEDMLHFPGLSLDGRIGQSTVYLSRQTIGLALSTEKHGAKFFGNGAVPRGILEIPGVLEPKALENLRRSWQEAHGGENAHKTAVLEQGVKYSPIGTDMEKSQFLETRKYQRRSIASVFNVPPHMIGEGENSKSSVEQTSIEFLHYCIGPWLDLLQQEFKRKLFDDDYSGGKKYFAKFDTHQLLYPNSDSRAKFYVSGKNWGWLSTNDIHELEDLNPVEDGSGDIYWMPVNMQDAANPLTAPHIGGAQNIPGNPNSPALKSKPEAALGGRPQNPSKKQETTNKKPASLPSKKKSSKVKRYSQIFYSSFVDATNRIQSRKEIDENSFRRCFEPALSSMIESISVDCSGNEDEAIPFYEFRTEALAFMEGMQSNLQGVTVDLNPTYAFNEVKRAAETFIDIVERRYNPDHVSQPRRSDGTWHDGSLPFYIGRHGTTDDDVRGCWSGWTSVPINEQGKKEIDETAEKLKDAGIRRIVCSNLERAKQTAYRISAALGDIPVSIDWRLNAMDLGIFAGENEKENEEKIKLYVNSPDTKIPGGESMTGYIERTNTAIDEIRGTNEETGPILVITHSSAIATYLCELKTLERSSCLLSPAGMVKIEGKKMTVISGTLGDGDAL